MSEWWSICNTDNNLSAVPSLKLTDLSGVHPLRPESLLSRLQLDTLLSARFSAWFVAWCVAWFVAWFAALSHACKASPWSVDTEAHFCHVIEVESGKS